MALVIVTINQDLSKIQFFTEGCRNAFFNASKTHPSFYIEYKIYQGF